MNKQDLMDAMSGIKPEFIAEAQEQRSKKPAAKPLPLYKKPGFRRNFVSAIGALAALAMLSVALPNSSPQVAQAMAKIPGIGAYFKLVTFRDYSYHGKKQEAKISASHVEVTGAENDQAQKQANKAAKSINREITAETDKLVSQFKQSLKSKGYKSVTVKTSVVANTKKWYTVRLTAAEIQADSAETNKYYVLSKQTGKRVELADLFKAGSHWQQAISENIIFQMRAAMKKDKNKSYFIKADGDPDGFSRIKDKQQFYFNQQDQLVIAFDQGVVAPMSMGSLKFVIPNSVVKDLYQAGK